MIGRTLPVGVWLGRRLEKMSGSRPIGAASSRLGATPGFAARSVDAEGGGRILILDGRPGLRPGAVADSLRDYGEGRLPFDALLIDFHGADYRFSSADLGLLLSAIAAWVRGRVAPGAVVLTSSAARELQQLLDQCKVNTIESLRIVGSTESRLDHVRLDQYRAMSNRRPAQTAGARSGTAHEATAVGIPKPLRALIRRSPPAIAFPRTVV